eukprot:3712520-Alexandrium_andersonii.AAC.1
MRTAHACVHAHVPRCHNAPAPSTLTNVALHKHAMYLALRRMLGGWAAPPRCACGTMGLLALGSGHEGAMRLSMRLLEGWGATS